MNWFYLWISFLSLFVLGLADNMRGPVFPDLLREFGLSDTRGALFFFVASAFGLGNNLLSGFWLPRLGPYRSLQLFLFLQAAGLLALGLSGSFFSVLAGAALLGAGNGGLGICMNIVVGYASLPRFRRQAYSALHCMYGVASLLAPLAVSLTYRLSLGWRATFLGLAAVPASLFAVSWARPDVIGSESSRRARGTTEAGQTHEAVWACLVISAYVIAEILVSSRFVLFARREFAVDAVQANSLLAGFFALLFLGRLAFVFLPERWPALTIMTISAAASVAALVAGVLLGPTALIVSGLTMAPFFPAAMTHLHERFGAGAARVQAWALTANVLGQVLMHAGVGWFSDLAGLRTAMWLGPVCLAFVLIILLLRAPRTHRNEPPP